VRASYPKSKSVTCNGPSKKSNGYAPRGRESTGKNFVSKQCTKR
jgi:hypothetical protein